MLEEKEKPTVIAKLREVEVELAKGTAVAQACRKIAVT